MNACTQVRLLAACLAWVFAGGLALAQASSVPPVAVTTDGLVPIVLLERVDRPTAERGVLPLLAPLSDTDPRRAEALRLIDNEAASFVRKLIARAFRLAAGKGRIPDGGHVLPIVLCKGGNHAEVGYRLKTGEKLVDHPRAPYVLLDLSPDRMSTTLLHEGGHVVHSICVAGRCDGTKWTPLPHTTFAVSDRITALAEGYAIHLETLWGHYGADPRRRAFYHRQVPAFGPGTGVAGEFFGPVKDLLSFSQNWARYQAVRDTLPAFAGTLHPGEYLRSQYEPSRDLSRLKSAQAMVASEGVVASVFFWTASEWARAAKAVVGGGLDQPAVLEAEVRLADVLTALPASDAVGFRPDIVDWVAACAGRHPESLRQAVECFVDITRGVTARPSIATDWRSFYQRAIVLDQARLAPILQTLEKARAEIVKEAMRDPATLRRAIGPVVPVQVKAVKLSIVALGESFPLEFDLNAITDAELSLMSSVTASQARTILTQLEERPFQSLADFERRTALRAVELGLTAVSVAP